MNNKCRSSFESEWQPQFRGQGRPPSAAFMVVAADAGTNRPVILNRLTLFRCLVTFAPQRSNVPPDVEPNALGAIDHLPQDHLRRDIGRQADDWHVQHHNASRSNAAQPPAGTGRLRGRCYRHNSRRAVLLREAMVVRLREKEKLPFKAIATRLGIKQDKARDLHARALTRRRRRGKSA